MNEKRYKIGIWLGCEIGRGGVFQYAITVLKALNLLMMKRPDRYEIVVLSPQVDWIEYLRQNTQQYPFPGIYVPKNILHKIIGNLLRRTALTLKLWRYLNRISFAFSYSPIYRKKCDLILCLAEDPLTYEVNLPVISTIHDLMHRYERQFPEAGNLSVYRAREKNYRNICRYARAILVDSNLGKQHVEESYGKYLKAQVIPLPYLPPPYIMDPLLATEPDVVKQKYQLPDRYLFYPAQFWMHKNHLRLIHAIDLLRKQGHTVPLLLAGSEKNNTQSVKDLIAELHLESAVKILGYVPDEDIIGIYKAATALIIPTFFGPTNIPIVEAIYLGTPVLCSDIYGHPEQVGNAGMLFNPTSVEDIADKIREIWTNHNLRNELANNCLEQREGMTLKNYAKRWENIIEEVMEK